MSRLPIPGSDNGTWGDVLNDFLSQEHNADGTQKTLPIAKGGTGATDAQTALSKLGAVSTTDSRLSDSRTPMAHKATHLGGTDDMLPTLDARYASANGSSQPKIVAALPTGVAATDTANLQALVTAINASGGNIDVCLAAGTYVVNAALGTVTVSNVRLWGHGVGATKIDFSAAPLSAVCLSFSGSVGTHKSLTADTAVSGLSLTCAAGDEAGLSADDYILIGSDAYYETRTLIYGAATGQKVGEIAAVASTASGTINLREPLAGGYTDESNNPQQVYKTADAGFFARVSFLDQITVEGITFIGVTGSGSGSTQNALRFDTCRGLRVRDVRFEHVAYCGVQIQDCIDFIVERWSAFDCWSTNTGYGIAVGNASQDGLIGYGHYRRGRHAFTTTGSSTGSGHGVARRITVAYVKVYDNTSDGFKTHACTGHIVFIGCHVYGSASNGATGYGYLIESNDAMIIGCWASRVYSGVQLSNETLNPTRFQVADFVVRSASNDGVRYTAPATSGAEPMIEYVNLGNLVLDDIAAVGVYIKGLVGHVLNGVSVSNAEIINCVNASATVYVIYCTAPMLSGIKVKRALAATVGIRFDNCTKPSLTGWVVEFASLSTGNGVYVNNTSDASITGGTCTNGGKGVNLDNTATYAVVTGNNVRGCTTPINPGTGTGHKVAHNVGDVQAQTAVTITSSPQTITNNGPRDVLIAVSGGTVSLVEVSNDQTNFSTVAAATGCSVYVPSGGASRVTYSSNPTLRQIPIL